MNVLYGINRVTKTLLPEFDQQVVLASTQGNESFDNRDVLNISELIALGVENIEKVIICSMYVEEISKLLIEGGFQQQQLYFFNCVKCQIEPVPQPNAPLSEDSVYFSLFDLAKSLPSFDAVNFFAYIDNLRKAKQLKHIHLLILPPQSSKTNFQTGLHHEATDVEWRTHQIILQLARCLPSIIGVSMLSFREQLYHYPLTEENSDISGYDVDNPTNMITFQNIKEDVSQGKSTKIFCAPEQASKLVKQYLDNHTKDKKLVLLNLREYKEQTFRNSDLDALAEFIPWLIDKGYFPAIIRDTYSLFDKLPAVLAETPSISSASIDLTMRIAFYQQAFVTISVNTGPSNAFYFVKDCNSIEFRWSDERHYSISKKVMEGTGFPFNQQPYFKSQDYNRVFWGKDTFSNLKKAFIQLEAEQNKK